MRLWLFVGLLATTALCAERPKRSANEEAIREVLLTWAPNVETKIIDGPEPISRVPRAVDLLEEEEEEHRHRSKRSIPRSDAAVGASFIAATKACQTPGYTGEYCEFPICSTNNPNVPDSPATDGEGATIDAAYLPGCTSKYVTTIDDTLSFITMELESSGNVEPTFYVQGEDGGIMFPDEVKYQTGTMYTVLFYSLPAGQYVIGTSKNQGVNDANCMLFVKAQTDMTLAAGFVSGDNSEMNDFPSSTVYLNGLSNFVVHTNRLRSPGSLKAVSIFASQNTMWRPKLLNIRYNCSYEYIYESFWCDKTGSYFYVVEGVDFKGNHFRRTNSFSCIVNPATTTTTSPAPVTSPTASTNPVNICKHGGIYLQEPDGTAFCFCIGLYGGDDCSIPICTNGGTLDFALGRCFCPEGYHGAHCENIICDESAGFGFDAEHPTLILAIRTRSQMDNVIKQITDKTTSIVNELQSFDPTYLTTYTLVLFNDNKIIYVNTFMNYNDLLKQLTNAGNTDNSNGNCTDIDFSAISTALSQYRTNGSPLYLITDALPNAEDYEQVNNIANIDSFWRIPIYILYVEPDASTGCTPSLDDPGYRQMDDLAHKTSGQVYYFKDQNTVGDFYYNHLYNRIYRSQLMTSMDSLMCGNQPLFTTVYVDPTVELLLVTATGTNLVLSVTTPETNQKTYETLYNDGYNFVWLVRGAHTGNWMFNVIAANKASACSMRVYHSGMHNAFERVQYDMFYALTQGLSTDAFLVQPLVGQRSEIVIHLNNYVSSPEFAHAGLTMTASRNGNLTQVYAANGIWRDGCTYNFYFPPFNCAIPDETLYFNFYARDNTGSSIQRAGTFFCATIPPTPFPTTDCQNGGVISADNSTCFCTPEWTGPFCTDIVCYNGGTAVGNTCKCLGGWTGISCEIPRCTEPAPTPELIRHNVDMIFALETTQQAYSLIFYLDGVFADLIRDIQSQHNEWIGRFVIVGFNSTWGDVIATAPFYDPQAVIDAVHNLALNVPTDTGCTVMLWEALDRSTMKFDTRPGSFVEIFSVSQPNDHNEFALFDIYEIIRNTGIQLNVFLGTTGTGALYCNTSYAPGTEYGILFGMVGTSLGATYTIHTSNLQQAIRVIPLQYSNGIAFVNYFEDCSVLSQDVYFPVDAWAQTIQLNVIGFNEVVTLFDDSGSPLPALKIYSDDVTGSSVYEYRKPCDDGWDQISQYCIHFGTQSLSYSDAQKFCHEANGFLADDMTNDKHAFLQQEAQGFNFWFGLENVNGTGYTWDRPTGVPRQQLGDVTFWAAGSEPPYDPVKKCVFWDSKGPNGNTWTTEDCNLKKPYVCQKHGYDQDYAPGTINDDPLPAGKYKVTIQTTNVQPGLGFCGVQARLQSRLQIYSGYALQINQDFPDPDPVNDSPNNRLITYIHSNDNEGDTPVLTHAMIADAYNLTFYDAARYDIRAQCSFPWVSQTFNCPNADQDQNEFYVTHIGTDERGNMFSRITLGHCSPPPLTCGNGGYRWNGTCVCDEYWTGRYCTVPVCVNGGYLDPDNIFCICPLGFLGRSCEMAYCEPNSGVTFSYDAKTLIVVVERSEQNRDAMKNLADNFNSLVANATQGANAAWFVSFRLVTYDSTGVQFNDFYSQPNALVQTLNSEIGKISDPGACQMPVYAAIEAAVGNLDNQKMMYPNSELLVIASSSASDSATRHNAIQGVSDAQAQLTYTYLATPTCGDIPTDDSWVHILYLALYSGGNALLAAKDTYIDLLNVYLPTLRGSSVLSHPTVHLNNTCTGSDWYVSVDSDTTTLYVTATNLIGTVNAKSPLGDMLLADVLFSNDQSKLYRFDVTGQPGIYSLSGNSPGTCYVHIYSVGGPKIFTRYAIAPSWDTNGYHQDIGYNGPNTNANNVAIVHLQDNHGHHHGKLQYVEAYAPGYNTRVLYSEMYERTGCSFEFFSDPFTCNYEFLNLYMYGVDDMNQEFRRQDFAYCSNGSITTQAPPTWTPYIPTGTQPSITSSSSTTTTTGPASTSSGPTVAPVTSASTGAPVTTPTTATTPPQGPTTTTYGFPSIKFDIAYLVDVSQEADMVLEDMNNFFYSLMTSFTVSQEKARVAIIPVFGDETWGPMIIAGFNSITSPSVLQNYLNGVRSYGDFDDQGQALYQALNQAINPNTLAPANGYRPDLTNHVIVYITSSSSFVPPGKDPQTVSQQILANNNYGIITIGVHTGANLQDQLTQIAGGAACSFAATNSQDLMSTVLPAVQNLIYAADSNGGKYCGN